MDSQYIAQLNITRWVLLSLLVFCCSLNEQAFAASDDKRGITIDDLAAVRDIESLSLSPDGKYVAFQIKRADKGANDYQTSWHVAATTSGAKAVKVAEGGEATVLVNSAGTPTGSITASEIVWSPDSRWIYFTKVKDGAIQLWRSHRNRYGHEQVTHNAGNVQDLRLSRDGSKIFFTIGRRRAKIEALIEQEARQGYVQQEPAIYYLMFGAYLPPCTDGRERVEYWDKEGSGRACLLTVWVYDIKSGAERKATKTEIEEFTAQEESWLAGYSQGFRLDQKARMKTASPDDRRLAWIENDDPDLFKGPRPPMVVTVSGEDDKSLRCPADACTSSRIQGLWWRPDGREVIFQVRDGRRGTLSSFYGWTPGEKGLRAIHRSNDRFYSCARTAQRLICGHESWTTPRKIVSVDIDNGKIATIVDMNPEFQDFTFTKIEKIFGEDDYGNLAHAHLVYPKDYQKGKRYPLVIVQYRSGGFLRGGVGDEQPIHVYAQHGMAVLSFDSPEVVFYDKVAEPRKNAITRYRYTIVQRGPATAIENMLSRLDKRGVIDRERVGISGLSYGSTILDSALLGRDYAAASAAYSITTSPNYTYSASSNLGKLYDSIFGGPPFSAQGYEMRRKFSIETNAAKIDTPFLLQVADREAYYSMLNYNALKDAGKPVEMIIYPDEYHVKWQPAHKYLVYRRNLDWFNFWLRGVEDPAPEKREQYQRWRELRELHEANLKEAVD